MKNYETVIDLLADKIKEQNSEISLLKWKVDDLKKKLESAEMLLPTKTTLEIRNELKGK